MRQLVARHHVVFFVRDVSATEQYYARTLGFVPSDRYPGASPLVFDSPHSWGVSMS